MPGNPLDLRDDASSDRYIGLSILLDSQDRCADDYPPPAQSRRAVKVRARD
jgi:hypothetical protein